MHQFRVKGLVICFIFLATLVLRTAVADEDPMSPMYEMNLSKPKTDLSARLLAGKVLRYGYHSFWEVNKDRGVRGAPAPMMPLCVNLIPYTPCLG